MDTLNSNLNWSNNSGLLQDALNDSAQHTTDSAVAHVYASLHNLGYRRDRLAWKLVRDRGVHRKRDHVFKGIHVSVGYD